MRQIPVRADFGFFLLLSLFLVLNQDASGVVWAVLLHELSHLLMMKLFRVRVKRISLEFWGIRIEREETSSLRREMLINLAGPAANFLAAFFFFGGWKKFSALNFALGLFELCPLPSLDGGQALMDFLQQRTSLERANHICRRVECMAFLLTAAAGGILLVKEKNPMLLILAVGIGMSLLGK